MTTSEPEENSRDITATSAYISVLYSLPIMFVFGYFERWEIGFGAGICAALVIMAIRTRWDLRKYVRFWLAIAFGALIQLPVVLLVPWDDRNLTGISLLPVGLLDFAIVYGLIRLAEYSIRKSARLDTTT